MPPGGAALIYLGGWRGIASLLGLFRCWRRRLVGGLAGTERIHGQLLAQRSRKCKTEISSDGNRKVIIQQELKRRSCVWTYLGLGGLLGGRGLPGGLLLGRGVGLDLSLWTGNRSAAALFPTTHHPALPGRARSDARTSQSRSALVWATFPVSAAIEASGAVQGSQNGSDAAKYGDRKSHSSLHGQSAGAGAGGTTITQTGGRPRRRPLPAEAHQQPLRTGAAAGRRQTEPLSGDRLPQSTAVGAPHFRQHCAGGSAAGTDTSATG